GRLNSAADRALSIATATLPICVASIFSKYTRLPPVSTMATAMAQLFRVASARAGAAAFFALSSKIVGPYDIGACAMATETVNASAIVLIQNATCGISTPFHRDKKVKK